MHRMHRTHRKHREHHEHREHHDLRSRTWISRSLSHSVDRSFPTLITRYHISLITALRFHEGIRFTAMMGVWRRGGFLEVDSGDAWMDLDNSRFGKDLLGGGGGCIGLGES